MPQKEAVRVSNSARLKKAPNSNLTLRNKKIKLNECENLMKHITYDNK